MSGRIDFALDFTTRSAKLKHHPDSQYRVYMLGCFSGRSDQAATPGKIHKIDRDTFDKEMVAPHISQQALPQCQQLTEIIEKTIGQFTLGILHDPKFQSLEALWRGIDTLLNEEAADRHCFYLLDIGQAELATEIKIDSKAFTQTVLQHIHKADGEQDVLIIGDFRFSGSADDNALMAYCVNLAETCNAQFLASVDQAFLQKTSDQDVSHKAATSGALLLVYPGFLLRLPYGDKRDPLDTIAFEECSAQPERQELLWGNAAWIVARALLRTAEDNVSSDALIFDDTPAFSFTKDGEPTLQPGTEVLLTEAQANELLAHGIMPLIGYQQRRGIRLLGF